MMSRVVAHRSPSELTFLHHRLRLHRQEGDPVLDQRHLEGGRDGARVDGCLVQAHGSGQPRCQPGLQAACSTRGQPLRRAAVTVEVPDVPFQRGVVVGVECHQQRPRRCQPHRLPGVAGEVRGEGLPEPRRGQARGEEGVLPEDRLARRRDHPSGGVRRPRDGCRVEDGDPVAGANQSPGARETDNSGADDGDLLWALRAHGRAAHR